MPKKTKFRKKMKGNMKGTETRGCALELGQYGFAEADTIMGKIGVKVWVFKGDLMPGEKADQNIKVKKAPAKENARFQRRPKRGSQQEAQNA